MVLLGLIFTFLTEGGGTDSWNRTLFNQTDGFGVQLGRGGDVEGGLPRAVAAVIDESLVLLDEVVGRA